MLALLFPGQGSQRPGMGAAWRSHPSWAVVDEVSDAVGRDVGALLVDADADTLKATRNAQVAAFTLSLVITDAARRGALGTPDGGVAAVAGVVAAVAGHSLGEYTALVAAGALSPSAAARLVAERGEAMQAAADLRPGTMAAVLGLESEQVAAACDAVDEAWMANDNAPGQVVIAGTDAGVAAASERAKELGAKRVMPLPVGGAFHSPLMAPAQDRLDAALQAAPFDAGAVPVVANVDGQAHARRLRRPAVRSAVLAGPLAPVAARPRRAGSRPLPGAGPGDGAVGDGQAHAGFRGPGQRRHPRRPGRSRGVSDRLTVSAPSILLGHPPVARASGGRREPVG